MHSVIARITFSSGKNLLTPTLFIWANKFAAGQFPRAKRVHPLSPMNFVPFEGKVCPLLNLSFIHRRGQVKTRTLSPSVESEEDGILRNTNYSPF